MQRDGYMHMQVPKGRIRAEKFADHYSQPRMFYRSQTMPEQAKKLAKDSATLDWFTDAYGHCKAIAYCGATDEHILSKLPIEKDAFVTPLADLDAFIGNAKSRLWEREPKVRDLA